MTSLRRPWGRVSADLTASFTFHGKASAACVYGFKEGRLCRFCPSESVSCPVSPRLHLFLSHPSPLPVSPSFRSEDRLLPCQVGVVKEGNMLRLTLAWTTAALKFDFLATRHIIFLSRFIYVPCTWPCVLKWSITDFLSVNTHSPET